MGFEYHNRRRNSRGQFENVYHNAQIHVYLDKIQWKTIKYAALMVGEDLSEFCRIAALQRVKDLLEEVEKAENG